MKKIVLAVVVLTFVPSLCFATNFANTKKGAFAPFTILRKR